MLRVSLIAKVLAILPLVFASAATATPTHGAIPVDQTSVWRLHNTNGLINSLKPYTEFQYIALTPHPDVTGPFTMQLEQGIMTWGVRENETSPPAFGTAWLEPQQLGNFFGYGFQKWPLFPPFVTPSFQAEFGCDASATAEWGFIHYITFLDAEKNWRILGTIIDCTEDGGKVEFRFNEQNGIGNPYNSGRFELESVSLEEAIENLS